MAGTMNFFEHQDRAKQNTLYLLVLFAIALIGMVLLIYLALMFAVSGSSTGTLYLWDPSLLLISAVGVGLFVGIGSVSKLAALRGGGKVVAGGLGGHLLSRNTQDPNEQQLLNIVDEMAIASGTPVPAVYLLADEPGINAFAAGFTPNDAVIGVTRGTLEQLSREELQGVIAHEFSHILNGDMTLNLRLIGVLQGILLIYLTGRVVARAGGRGRSRGDGKIVAVGLALILIGSLGLLCGRLIKSAVSRQREFLADASAVQFTRNPSGIAGALRKIGGLSEGSLIEAPNAEEISHLFFGEALRFGFFGQGFATHPPLQQRIQRIEGKRSTRPKSAARPTVGTSAGIATNEAVMGLQGDTTTRSPQKPEPSTHPAADVVEAVGTATPQHLAYAHTLLSKLPEPIRLATRERTGALSIVYGFLLDKEKREVRDRQIAHLKENELPEVVEQTIKLAPLLHRLDLRFRLPLIDLTIPALRETSAQQCSRFLQQVQVLVQMDQRVTLGEYALQVVLYRRLSTYFSKPAPPKTEFTTLDQVWDDCLVLLSALAQVGHSDKDGQDYAFRSGIYRLPGAGSRELPKGVMPMNLAAVGNSLKRLGKTAPKLKQIAIDACAHTVLLDNNVTIQEAELLRVVVIALDCPIPPFLDASLK
ncbi:M48 family metallopeptidase [Vacuolonema iberomarrocanum]|uniref:M48 family metallopeptidase n=1 Tax=Vacuolonema iberomarrocanum TaxID=3454632 RepID=UPI003F6DBF4A